METQHTIQQAMHALLAEFGFAQMAKDVLKETEDDRLRLYARVIRKNAAKVSYDLGYRVNFLLVKAGY